MGLRQLLNTFYAFLVPEGVSDEDKERIDGLLNQEPLSPEQEAQRERERKAKLNAEALKGIRAAFALPS